MNRNEMTKLLEKYFRGETSLAEERLLKDYFNQPNVPESLRDYQPLFQFLRMEQEQMPTKEFTVKDVVPAQSNNTIIFLKKWIPRVAATVLMVLSLWALLPTQQVKQEASTVDWSKYEPETPEEAFRITHGALMKTSLGLQKGASQAVQEVAKVKEFWQMFK